MIERRYAAVIGTIYSGLTMYRVITYSEEKGLQEFDNVSILDSLEEDQRIWIDIEAEDDTELTETC